MNHNGIEAAATPSARRRLLRGALAVPTVMTLSTGSALAASSSLVCASKLPDGVEIGAEDNFFRVQRYTVTRAADDSGMEPGTRLLVKGDDITSMATIYGFSADAYVGSKDWILVTDGSDQTAWVAGPPALTPEAQTSAWVALRFTNSGTDVAPYFTVTGLSDAATPGSGTGKVMTDSCWSSFKPGPAEG